VIFNSLTFLVFLLLVVTLFWALPRRPRLWMLFLGSLVFYGFWRVEFLSVMLLSTVIDYWAAGRIGATEDRRRKRLYLGVSLSVNLGLLFYFKYLIFFAENATGLLQALGFDVAPPAWSIILPLGISFYTFQTLSYTIDVYRGFIQPERNFALYGCYVTFFPQLVAGPILRASEVMKQLSKRPAFRLDDLTSGLSRILAGLFLKVVFADNLAPMVESSFAQPVASLGALDVWTMAFLFGFQIYFDFAGYSHIALGCARMMGISFPENFNFPYAASSPKDFWRRWHISLGSWIRDYLYLPLTGQRVRDRSTGGLALALGEGDDATKKTRNKNRALFESWAIMGLWHGANWTFVFWGLYHATLVYLQRRIEPLFAGWSSRTSTVLGVVVTLPLSMLGWIPFRAESLTDALIMMSLVFDPRAYFSLGLRENTYLVAFITLVLVSCGYAVHRWILPALQRRPVAFFTCRAVSYAVMITLVFVFLRPISQFIYFQF
jgi:D-alanyl-lipoteichoic acid acyltransferase DltB (MBOAT superfamily)